MRADIAFYSYDQRGSGVVRNLLRIADSAAKAGLSVEIWVNHHQGELAGQLPADLPLREIGGPRLSSRFIDSLLSARRLAKAIAIYQPRIFFSSGNHAHLPASLAWRMAGRPSATRFTGRASNALVDIGMANVLARPIERFQYRAMNPLIAVSHELAQDLERRLRIPGRQIQVIPNGVDIDAVNERAGEPIDHPWLQPGEPPVILGIGRLDRQKNFSLLIKAFALARRNRQLRLMVLGRGSDRQRGKLLRLARTLGVADDVLLAGFDSNPWRYLARAGLFVLSSRWEGASNSLIEALACGCPVVATACPTGVREVLETGDAGLLVPVDDPGALADAMLRRLASPRDEQKLLARAADFRIEATLSAYITLLQAVVSGN
jgi:glycosyltransferase involved in cell wall biosynthesis